MFIAMCAKRNFSQGKGIKIEIHFMLFLPTLNLSWINLVIVSFLVEIGVFFNLGPNNGISCSRVTTFPLVQLIILVNG